MFSNKLLRVLITLSSTIFIVVGTILAVQFAKGYRLSRQGTLSGTGLLAATSIPDGAHININGEFVGQVTDETVNLKPGTYEIEITKEGYTSWKKTLKLEPEVVTATNAHLFRSVPSLSPLTFSGAKNLLPSPDGQKIAFTIASPSAELQEGLYLLELTDRPSPFSKPLRQIAQNPPGRDVGDADLLWSPDSTQILISFGRTNYLIDINSKTLIGQFIDITRNLPTILAGWEEEIGRRDRQLLALLPQDMLNIATSSAKNLYFSPNSEKLLYTATSAVTIPEKLIPPLPGSNSQPQNRTLEAGNTYVYDLKEDTNFLLFRRPAELPDDSFTKISLVSSLTETLAPDPISTVSGSFRHLQVPGNLKTTIANFAIQYSPFPKLDYQWFPTSSHLLVNQNGQVTVVEYDNTNQVTLYAGTYYDNFAYPWPDGSKLVILANLTNNPSLPPNLYSINLK